MLFGVGGGGGGGKYQKTPTDMVSVPFTLIHNEQRLCKFYRFWCLSVFKRVFFNVLQQMHSTSYSKKNGIFFFKLFGFEHVLFNIFFWKNKIIN